MEPKSLRGGIDVGSTTVKVVIMDENNDSVYQTYQRHFSDVLKRASEEVLREAAEAVGLDTPISFTITGSGGMGLADVLNLKFIPGSYRLHQNGRGHLSANRRCH